MNQNQNKDPQQKKKEDFNWNRVTKIVLGWSVILIGFFLLMIYTKSSDTKYTEIGVSQYRKLLE